MPTGGAMRTEVPAGATEERISSHATGHGALAPAGAHSSGRSTRLLSAFAGVQGGGARPGGEHNGRPTALQLGGATRARQRLRVGLPAGLGGLFDLRLRAV